jgi:hypothetical protein
MSSALRSVGLLDILSRSPAGPQKLTCLHLARSAKRHARLGHLAMKFAPKIDLISNYRSRGRNLKKPIPNICVEKNGDILA